MPYPKPKTTHRGRGYLASLNSSDLAAISARGGAARAQALTAEQRSDICRRAVEARWSRTAELRAMLAEITSLERERRRQR